MTSLSIEEENYVRMSLLLTGISPRAVRTFFDIEFHPASLDYTIKKENRKLLDLRKRGIINQVQWNLLNPRFPDVLDSKTLDVTLMIYLLKYLTNITPPLGGFDCLPSSMETTPGADLARIKYYRNYLAHLNDAKIDSVLFMNAWIDLNNAIGRLGGPKMKQVCDHLKTKPLDQTNQEIMMDIKHSNVEIRELKDSIESLIKSHELLQEDYIKVKKSHAEVKKSNELLQVDHADMTKQLQTVMHSQNDTVPWNVREQITKILEDWTKEDFIITRTVKHVLKSTRENSCVTITASCGVGKTATLRQVALQMADEGYDIIIVSDPGDIVKFHNPNKKTLFVVDDLCGNFSVNQSDIKSWEPVMENIKHILEKKEAKLIAACRLQVYMDEKFRTLSVFKTHVSNLMSDSICLTKTEKQSIAELYLKAEAPEITDYYDLYDCFPLLCKLYHENPKRNVTDFFQNPFSVFEAEIDMLLQKGHYTKYCALALCVMFNNKLKEEMFTEELDQETRVIIENTCEACRLDRGTSRLILLDELTSLQDTFIKKKEHMYRTIHAKIFDFLSFYFGQKIIRCLIINADSGLIKERFLLERKDDMEQFITVIPPKYHQLYIHRMIDDWSKGKVQDVFSNINMKISQFRQKFLCYLKTLDLVYQKQLAHTSDVDSEDTALIQSCLIGDIYWIQWCIYHNIDINQSRCDGVTPLITACYKGHKEIVSLLLNNKADILKGSSDGMTPLSTAKYEGHSKVVELLLDNKATPYECFDDLPKAGSLTELYVICDGMHILCFTDKRLDTICRDAGMGLIKRDVTLQDLFYQIDGKSKLSKVKTEYQVINSLIKCQNKAFIDKKEILHLAVVHKMSLLCRWLLSYYSYEDNCLIPALSKSYKIGYNDAIKALSWRITREFYKRYKDSLKGKVVDIYPAYQCQCHSLTKKHKCLRVSKKMIVIECIEEKTPSIPDTFWNFQVSYFKYNEINESSNMPQPEMKEILKKMSNLCGPNAYSIYLPEIDGHIAFSLFKKHRNLSLICPSTMKSSGYGKKNALIQTFACVQLFCHRKGIIPLGESHFPKNVSSIPTDILQGRGHFAARTNLRVGEKIGTATSCGTLGGFYDYMGSFECFLTCAHVLLGLSNLIAPADDLSKNKGVDVILNPHNSQNKCGKLLRRVFSSNPGSTSIDAALVLIESQSYSVDEEDIVRDSYGASKSLTSLGLVSKYVNHNYCDHHSLITPKHTVSTVAPGAFSKLQQNVKFDNLTAKDSYFKNIGNVAANVNGANFQPLIMASPAHMQLPVGSLGDGRVFTMYNQMVMNIPLQQGDSGTCIYITGNTPNNTGCVGMANSFCSGSGLTLVTPIGEIIKAINT